MTPRISDEKLAELERTLPPFGIEIIHDLIADLRDARGRVAKLELQLDAANREIEAWRNPYTRAQKLDLGPW